MSGWQPIASAPRDSTRIVIAWSGPAKNISILTGKELTHYATGEALYWMPLPPFPDDTRATSTERA